MKRPVAWSPPVEANAACASRSRSGSVARSAAGIVSVLSTGRRLDGDRLERALAADAARRRRVERPRQPVGIEPGRLELDRVRGQVVRDAGRRAAAGPPRARTRARAPRRGPGVRIVTATGAPPIRSSSGSSTRAGRRAPRRRAAGAAARQRCCRAAARRASVSWRNRSRANDSTSRPVHAPPSGETRRRAQEERHGRTIDGQQAAGRDRRHLRVLLHRVQRHRRVREPARLDRACGGGSGLRPRSRPDDRRLRADLGWALQPGGHLRVGRRPQVPGGRGDPLLDRAADRRLHRRPRRSDHLHERRQGLARHEPGRGRLRTGARCWPSSLRSSSSSR